MEVRWRYGNWCLASRGDNLDRCCVPPVPLASSAANRYRQEISENVVRLIERAAGLIHDITATLEPVYSRVVSPASKTTIRPATQSNSAIPSNAASSDRSTSSFVNVGVSPEHRTLSMRY